MNNNNPTNNILEALEKSILDGYNVTKHYVDIQKNTLTLIESHPDAKYKEVVFGIENPNPKEILVFKFDKKVVYEEANENHKAKTLQHPLLFLKGTTPLRALCDYIVFYNSITKKGKEHLVCILFNLKSNNSDNTIQQMQASEIFAKFLYNTSIRFHNFSNTNTSGFQEIDFYEIKYHQITIYNKIPNAVKSKTNQKAPQNPIKINITCNNDKSLDELLYT